MEQVVEREMITMCIKYSTLEVKELSELLYIINLSINDYYRANGISGSQLSSHAPKIQAVRQGSIDLDLALALLENIAVGVAIELIAGHLKDRICTLLEKYKSGNTKRQIFNYEITTRIEIRIENGKIIIEVKRRPLITEIDESL